MAQVRIKPVKAFSEQKVQAKGLKENILVGIKVYTESEKASIRKEYLAEFSTAQLSRWAKELEELRVNTDISEDVFNETRISLETKITERNESYGNYQDSFCREHIVYVKNASIVLELEDDAGVVKDEKLLVTDSREAKPVESLWANADECLVVLLDFYLENSAYRDSLHTAVSNAVFQTDYKGLEAKN